MSNRIHHKDPEPTPFPGGKGVAKLEAAVRLLAEGKDWGKDVPLPTTRDLGERYRISNASVCRLFQRLGEDEIIWRRDNGRYYLNESRKLYERRKTYACLLRKLQTWSRRYQGIMEGFSQAFEQARGSMLFVHNESLVRHLDTAYPPVNASADIQREALESFFREHDERFDGILLDDVWLDEALEEFDDRLENALIVCRPSRLAGLASVSPDFDSGAVLAIGHLYARSYEEVWLAIPFADSAPIDLMSEAACRAASVLGRPIDDKNIHLVSTPEERSLFTQRLKAEKKRVGVFCMEDNIARIIWEDLREADIRCPEHVGIISGSGADIVTDRFITSLQIDYEAIGLRAGQILVKGTHEIGTLPISLVLGRTT